MEFYYFTLGPTDYTHLATGMSDGAIIELRLKTPTEMTWCRIEDTACLHAVPHTREEMLRIGLTEPYVNFIEDLRTRS